MSSDDMSQDYIIEPKTKCVYCVFIDFDPHVISMGVYQKG